jgi:hypothetical protein
MDPDLLLENIVSTVKTANTPCPLSIRRSTSHRDAASPPCGSSPSCSRTTPRSTGRPSTRGEDADFVAAVHAIGRCKLIACALWTEICMAFPALDALREGTTSIPSSTRSGGTSEQAHRAGLERVVQAGGRPVSWVALACELQRDWAREETVADIVEIVLTNDCYGHERGRPTPQARRADPEARVFLRNAYPILERVLMRIRTFRPRAWIDELPGLDAASSQPEDASLGRATRLRGGVPRPSG